MSFKTSDYYCSLSSAAVGTEKFTTTQITAKSRHYKLNRCIVNAISSSLFPLFLFHFSIIISYYSVSIPVQSVFDFCVCLSLLSHHMPFLSSRLILSQWLFPWSDSCLSLVFSPVPPSHFPHLWVTPAVCWLNSCVPGWKQYDSFGTFEVQEKRGRSFIFSLFHDNAHSLSKILVV